MGSGYVRLILIGEQVRSFDIPTLLARGEWRSAIRPEIWIGCSRVIICPAGVAPRELVDQTKCSPLMMDTTTGIVYCGLHPVPSPPLPSPPLLPPFSLRF